MTFSFYKRLLLGIGYGFLLCTFVFMAKWCFEPTHFPIRQVKFSGVIQHLTANELEQVIEDDILAGFFRLKISTLQQHLLSLPWAKQVEITRVWPDKIVIDIKEHQPRAFWGDKAILSQTGVLFYPSLDSIKKIKNLPLLQGPDKKHALVFAQYQKMLEILEPFKLSITEVDLAPRGAWQIRLSNGILVILGTNDILSRLRFFARAYDKYLYTRQPEVASVDLRYTKGMAVGWVTI